MLLRIINFNVTTYISVSQPVCHERFPDVPRKISDQNYLGTSNIAFFRGKICKIRGEDRFYLERTDFGKENDKREREFRRRPFFFRKQLIVAAKMKKTEQKIVAKAFMYRFPAFHLTIQVFSKK